jgi:hypothetical protein
MTLDVVFSPLALEPRTFNVGDTIRVSASFKYTVGVDTTVTVQAGPYQYKLGVLDRIGSCFGSTDVSLPKAVTPTEKQFTVDFKLVPKADGGIDNGTYGLIVEIPGTDLNAKQDGVLIVTGNPASTSIWDMIPMLVMVMMLGMIMPMMSGMTGGE